MTATSSSADALVRVERRDRVAVLTLDRPDQLNALSVGLVEQAVAELEALDADASVGAVVLTGAGRAFSAGGDLVDIAARVDGNGEWERLALLRALQKLVLALRGSRLPVVAAAHGPVFGAGWSVVLACDLVVAAPRTRFCQVFVKRDLVPDLGSAWLLQRAVGVLRAKELMLTGDELSAEEALAAGLVNRVSASVEDVVDEAVALAERAAVASAATVAMTKDLIHVAQQSSLEDALRLEQHAQAMALGSEASRRAIASFTAKSRG